MQLKGKVAYITGAASGIGREIAAVYAREGAHVVIADLNKDAADATAELSSSGPKALGVAVGVTSEEQVEEFSFSEWKKMLAIHLDGAFLTTRACVKSMIASGKGGSILYMGSVHSKEASKLKAPYVTAKHGLIGLAKVVAKEGAAHNIRTNVICPSYPQTPTHPQAEQKSHPSLRITAKLPHSTHFAPLTVVMTLGAPAADPIGVSRIPMVCVG